MTDTKCEFCACSKLPLSGEGVDTFTSCPNCCAKSVVAPMPEDATIVEVEFVTKNDAI